MTVVVLIYMIYVCTHRMLSIPTPGCAPHLFCQLPYLALEAVVSLTNTDQLILESVGSRAYLPERSHKVTLAWRSDNPTRLPPRPPPRTLTHDETDIRWPLPRWPCSRHSLLLLRERG